MGTAEAASQAFLFLERQLLNVCRSPPVPLPTVARKTEAEPPLCLPVPGTLHRAPPKREAWPSPAVRPPRAARPHPPAAPRLSDPGAESDEVKPQASASSGEHGEGDTHHGAKAGRGERRGLRASVLRTGTPKSTLPSGSGIPKVDSDSTPDFPVPTALNAGSFLRQLCKRQLCKRC